MLPALRARRGFTLVELMAVVAIVGIVAALALVGYRKYIHAASASEAKQVMASIHVGEGVYRADNLGYLDCSGTLSTYFPRSTPDSSKASWINTGHADWGKWQRLGVSTDSVKLVYAVIAGVPGLGSNPPAVPDMTSQPVWPTPVEPWFVVHARGDIDGDLTYSSFVSSSFNHVVYAENEDE